MPEGHTIHRLARDLNKTLKGTNVIASSPQGRFATEAAQLNDKQLVRAEAFGKHLFLEFEDAPLLHVHLGLIGKFRKKAADATEEGQIRLRLIGTEWLWDLTGPMTCAFITTEDQTAILADLGPDPLRRGSDAADFGARLGRKRIALAAALLDQKVIAGVGNVYRSEFCFLGGLRPDTPANTLEQSQVDELWETARTQLRQGVRLNRITTREPSEVGVAAGRIAGDDRLYVYKREGLPCHRCGAEIRLSEIANRKVWYCPSCQT